MKTTESSWITYSAGRGLFRVSLLTVLSILLSGAASAQDDAYEENDTLGTAYDLGSWEGQWLSADSGLGMQADVDWYRIEVAPGDHRVQGECLFTHADGDIDILLVAGDGMALASSVGIADDELIDAYVPGPGTFYVTVYGVDAGNAYDLRWNSLPDDTYEENDTQGGAFDLTGWKGNWLSTLNGPGISIFTDEDWYEIEVLPGQERVLIDCLFTHADGDIDIALYDPVTSNAYWSSGTDDNEHLDLTTTSASNTQYFILVHLFSGIENSYNILWDTVSTNSCPLDDAYEENDTPASAYTGLVEATTLSSIAGLGVQADEDWYAIDVAPGDLSVIVECLFSNAVNDIELRLWDSTLSVVAGAYSSTDHETLRTPVSGPGRYYIQVVGEDMCPSGYNLEWNAIVDDAYEDNDDLLPAYDLRGWEGRWLTELHGPGYKVDEDWYRIEVPASQERLLVDCLFDPMGGNIELGLTDSIGGVVTFSSGSNGSEHIDAVVSNGTYYVVVIGDITTNRYNLRWNVLVPGACASDDNYEENDTTGSAFEGLPPATWLTDVSEPGLQCDEDWFRIEVPPGGERVLIDCLFAHADGDIDLELWDSGPSVLAGEDSVTDNEHLEFDVPAAGSYYIRVFLGNASSAYNLMWRATPPDGYPGDDAYEENDSFATGYGLLDAAGAWLSSLAGPGVQCDEDWYVIQAETGEERLAVECVFTHDNGDIDIELWDSSGVRLASSWGITDVETVDHVVLQPGLFFIRVLGYPGPGACNSYDLRWTGLPRYGPPCRTSEVALFFDGNYVDLVADYSAEAEGPNVLAALTDEDLAVVTTFTGITAQAFNTAVADADILYVPELEWGNLGADLDVAARGAISNYVAGGGCMILNGSVVVRAAPFVNSVFGFQVSGAGFGSAPMSVLNTNSAAGTAFAYGPVTLAGNDAIEGWDVTTLPPGAIRMFDFVVGSNSYTSVAIIPVGSGRIIYLGYDWYDAVPVGTQDGDWHEILARAVSECAGCLPPKFQIVDVRATAGLSGTEVTVDTLPSHRCAIEYTDDSLALPAPAWHRFADTSFGIGTWLELGAFPSVYTFIDDYSPATSGADTLTGRRFYRAVQTFQCPIAMVADPSIVDVTPGDPTAEATTLQATLNDLGYCANAFTGLTEAAFNVALLNAETLIAPDQEVGGLSTNLTAAAMGIVSNYVAGGGRMIVHGKHGGEDADFVNAVFGYGVISHGRLSGSSQLTAAAAGTGFAGGPAQLPDNNAIVGWDTASLPPGAGVVYELVLGGTNAVTNATVAIVPEGSGKIIFLGWDWHDAAPLGTQDGGWIGILDTALTE